MMNQLARPCILLQVVKPRFGRITFATMKKYAFIIALLLSMIADAQVPSFVPVRAPINGQWSFRQAGQPEWKPVTAPVSAHTALLQNNMIEDPFFRANEEKLQWIEQEDWEFQMVFTVDDALLQHKHIEMIFRGLDTYAQVYLNDSLILEADNMFRRWTVDVKKWLQSGENRLHFYFESPVKKVAAAWDQLGYQLPGGIRTMTRKAQFHYGWDWGPRFAGCGILHLPELQAWNDLLIENVYITPQSLSPDRAKMVARIRYRSDVTDAVTFIAREGKRKSIEERKLQIGVNEDSISFEVSNPKLWWCNGMGEPNLYDFIIEIKKGARSIERIDVRTGIRTIELVKEKDGQGESFYFRLNGKPVFAKGANYIPQDIFQDRVRPEQYRRLMDDVVSANMNMLRVWGGGIYEDELFYQLCDARGIMVWQDFMYACAMYPGGRFLKNAAAEALEQLERLRHHPSISLWCGNNENNEGWHNWGWQMQFNEAQRAQVWRDYQLLFNELLPTYVERNGGGVPYWESSPRYGRANPKSHTEGDSHYWGVFIDEQPFDAYNKKVPRFMSEYGFQSFPEWRTIQSYTLPEDRELESKVMLTHQKHPRGNAIIADYIKRDYRPARDFEHFVYLSQLVQAEGIRIGIEAHRRNKPYCMGSLYWQLNDVWPVTSWSSRDYYGRWKALHYYAREAFNPLGLMPVLEGDLLRLYAANDTPEPLNGDLYVRVLAFDGTKLDDITALDITVPTDSSRMIWQGAVKTLLKQQKPENVVVEWIFKDRTGKILNRRLFYLAPPKKLNLAKAPIRITVAQANDGYILNLSCDSLAKNVMIQTDADGFFTDNYFDLLPGERKSVLFKTDRIIENPQAAFRLRSLAE